jgi:hypothetical protein
VRTSGAQVLLKNRTRRRRDSFCLGALRAQERGLAKKNMGRGLRLKRYASSQGIGQEWRFLKSDTSLAAWACTRPRTNFRPPLENAQNCAKSSSRQTARNRPIGQSGDRARGAVSYDTIYGVPPRGGTCTRGLSAAAEPPRGHQRLRRRCASDTKNKRQKKDLQIMAALLPPKIDPKRPRCRAFCVSDKVQLSDVEAAALSS